MSSNSNILSLRALFVRAIQAASKASKLETMDNGTQDLVNSSLNDLKALARAVGASGMFSPNESLEDLSTSYLPYMLVEYVAAQMESRARTLDHGERLERLENSQQHLQMFLQRLHQYEIISDEEQKIYSQKSSSVKAPAKRRELKIKQFKAEKELRAKLEIIHNRKGQPTTSISSSDDLDLIAAMLPQANASEEEQQGDDDEDLRHTYLLIIRLMWAQAQSQLESMEQELELLHSAPSLEPESSDSRVQEDREWRLDPSMPRGGPDGKGPLMDSSGRPLRPFTILPGSISSNRSQIQAEVFRPDHRLPTMTMDEYLAEEERRGNIIKGGGPQSQYAPTRTEQLTLDSEMDGTVSGEMKADEKRHEDERWAQYTDVHPKGEGNTMNRG